MSVRFRLRGLFVYFVLFRSIAVFTSELRRAINELRGTTGFIRLTVESVY